MAFGRPEIRKQSSFPLLPSPSDGPYQFQPGQPKTHSENLKNQGISTRCANLCWSKIRWYPENIHR